MYNGFFTLAMRQDFVRVRPQWGRWLPAYTSAERAEERDHAGAYMAGGEL